MPPTRLESIRTSLIWYCGLLAAAATRCWTAAIWSSPMRRREP
jgi:hypothetical protein